MQRKRTMIGMLTAMMLLTSPTLIEAKDPSVVLDGNALAFDQPPKIVKGRMLIPIRVVMEGLQAEVNWNQETKTIYIVKDSVNLELRIGSSFAKVNGESKEFDAAAQLINGRTYVPLRFISETMGANVTWDAKESQVSIKTRPVGGSYAYIIGEDGAIDRVESFQRPEKLEDDKEYVQFTFDRGRFHSSHFTSWQFENERLDVLISTEGTYDFSNKLKGEMKIFITDPSTKKTRHYASRAFEANINSFDTFPITARGKLSEMYIELD